MSIKLFIGGFHLDQDEISLAQLIAPHGNIKMMNIGCDNKTHVAKGYAFVEMSSEDGATTVIVVLDGEAMCDRKLTVKLAETKTATPAPNYEKVQRLPERKLRPRRPRL